MTETILLGILGFLFGVLLFLIRRWRPLTSRWDAVARFASMFIAALIAHAFYVTSKNVVWYLLAVAFNAFFLYGASHFIDRVITAGAGIVNAVSNRFRRS